ncbi:MAG TPA: hypothetical protein VK674_05965 [Candidatus Limnocylindria bacterium]|nr:hypothetical protein [Candidatus Limnocylindria bacterium]
MHEFIEQATERRRIYDHNRNQAKLLETQDVLEKQRASEARERELQVAARFQPLIAATVKEAAKDIAPILPEATANVALWRQPKRVVTKKLGVATLLFGVSYRVTYEEQEPKPAWLIRRHIASPRGIGFGPYFGSIPDFPQHEIEETGLVVDGTGQLLTYEICHGTGNVSDYEVRRTYQKLSSSPSSPFTAASYRPATDAEIAPLGSITPHTDVNGVPIDISMWRNRLLSLIPA